MKTTLGLLLLFALGLATTPVAAAPGDSSSVPVAADSLVLTVEGRVDRAPAGSQVWSAARTNQTLLAGDRVRTGLRSRATLRLSDLSLLRMDALTTLEIRPPEPGRRMLLELRSGSTYLFNREKPSDLQFRTPVASGAIRGTEFHLRVSEADGRTELTLLEGEVHLSNTQGELTLARGEQGVVEPGQPPRKTAVLDVLGVIQWALYYPGILDAEEAGLSVAEKQTLQDSLAAYAQGDLLAALAAYPADRQPATDAEKVYFAALLLSVGQVGQAEAVLATIASASPLPESLGRLIAVVKKQASQSAPSTEPVMTTSLMAESYRRQALSDLPGALDYARRATERSPNLGFAWARVAELEFSFGRVREAEAALDRALELSPRNAQAVALRGFLLAARNRTREALRAFDDAIAIDGALGNAWLGRGLCRIREGDRAAGRADLQMAATLEPQRSLLRSYLGKAWSHEGDPRRAEKELRLARDSDPNDPTPWLYSALILQEQNRVNESVRDLERSADLNDQRGVFRSRLMLDQDRSVRSANLAAIYRDAGMRELSAREASRAVSHDYGNYSAHLFLANSYDALRDPKLINLRYETPWFSELLVAQLLAPPGAGPLSRNVSQQEYSRLFDGDRLGVSSSTEYFSNGEWVQRGAQYGYLGNSSYSLDAYYRSDPGQRPNNDFEQLALSATFKQQLTAQDSIFLQAQYYDGESGDVAQYYSQTNASRTQRVEEKQEPNVFLGYHREWGPGSHTLFLAGWLDDTLEFQGRYDLFNLFRAPDGSIATGFLFPYAAAYEHEFNAATAELQQIWQNERHTLIVGGRFQSGELDTFVATNPLPQSVQSDLERASAYAYWHWRVYETLQLQGGVSYDRIEYPENVSVPPFSSREETDERVSPKAGFYFTPRDGTVLRGAYSQSLGGVFYDTSVRLEPTQLGGFNQAFRSLIPESVIGLVPGTRFETFGLALDQRLHTGTYLSVSGEWLLSEAQRSVGAFDLGAGGATATTLHEAIDYSERSLLVTLNQLLGRDWSIGATYRLTEASLEQTSTDLPADLAAFTDRDENATLHQVNLSLNYHRPCGFFAQAIAVWSSQDNDGYSPALPGDDFWQFHVWAGYRFLRRRVEARVGLLNITDEEYRLNPLTLYNELPRERTFAASLKFFF